MSGIKGVFVGVWAFGALDTQRVNPADSFDLTICFSGALSP